MPLAPSSSLAFLNGDVLAATHEPVPYRLDVATSGH
jgi:hypothetical protein